MSKFNTIFEDHLKNTGLTRIRILFDPANEDSEHGDYVGYVLRNMNTVKENTPSTISSRAGKIFPFMD